MKKLVLVSITCFMLFIALTSTDALQKLNVSTEQGQQYVFESVTNGYLHSPSSARQVSPTLRVDVAKGIAEFAKAYTQTSLFKSRYADWWKNSEPKKPQTVEERQKAASEQQAHDAQSQDEGIKNLKQQIAATTDPQLKKSLQEGLVQYEQAMKQIEEQKKTPEMQKLQADMSSAQKQQYAEDYKRELASYNKEHDEWLQKKDPNLAIKKLLQKYMELVNTVKFDAKTVKSAGGVMVFADADLQSKPADWKQCYRAGKEVNDFGKSFAQQWLNELK